MVNGACPHYKSEQLNASCVTNIDLWYFQTQWTKITVHICEVWLCNTCRHSNHNFYSTKHILGSLWKFSALFAAVCVLCVRACVCACVCVRKWEGGRREVDYVHIWKYKFPSANSILWPCFQFMTVTCYLSLIFNLLNSIHNSLFTVRHVTAVPI